MFRLVRGEFERRVVLASFPPIPGHREALERRIAHVRSSAPPESVKTYGVVPVEGSWRLVTGCPDGTPLSIVASRLRPDRVRAARLAAGLVSAVSQALRSGLVHGYLSPRTVFLAAQGGIEIAEYVQPHPGRSWELAVGPAATLPASSPSRDVFATAFLVHLLLRLSPEPSALLSTLASSPHQGLLYDLLRVKNPVESEELLRALVAAFLPCQDPIGALARLQSSLPNSIELANTLVPGNREAAPAVGQEKPTEGERPPARRRARLFPLLPAGLSFLATALAPFWLPGLLAWIEARGDTPAGEETLLLAAGTTAPQPDGAHRGETPTEEAEADSLAEGKPVSYIERIDAGGAPPATANTALLSVFDTAVADFPDEPRVWFDRGRHLLQQGEAQKALEDFDHAIRLASSADRNADRQTLYDAHLHRALALYQLGRAEGILADLIAAREILPERHEAFYCLGRFLDRAGRHASAVDFYSEALASGKETFQGLLHRGASRYYRGDRDGATADLRRALLLAGDAPGPYCYLARIEADRGNREEASRLFHRCLDLDPENYEGLFYFASLRFEEGAIEEAGELFLAAVRSDPERPGGYNGLGLLAIARNDVGGAITLFERALSLQPAYSPALKNRANARFHRGAAGDLDLAISDLLRAIQVTPEDAEAHLLLGAAFVRAGKETAALDEFSRAIVLEPQNARAYYNRGSLYLSHQNAVRARADFLQAADADPTYPLPRLALGHLANASGDSVGALAWYREAAKAAPANADAHNYLGATLAVLGRLAEAVEALDRAVELAPDSVRSLANRADCLLRLERWGEALRDLDRALLLDPGNAGFSEMRARLIEYLAKLEDARSR
ncbi:MAG: tetratricopeptide repeat protein [Planctomycetes bacterium]|nr:tetratricopeptide repeat protein [Planctomycetota bacterium]